MLKSKLREYTLAVLYCSFLLAAVDLMTNQIGGSRVHADLRNYTLLFNEGLGAQGLEAPYAYRYIPAFIAKGIATATGLSIFQAFAWYTWVSLLIFMLFIYRLMREMGLGKTKAYYVLAVLGFTLCHMKFLLFDPTRPDALAFALMAAAFLFCHRKNFIALVIITAVGLQVREFMLIPFLGYLASNVRLMKQRWIQLLVGAFVVVAAIIIPRVMIETSADFQFIPFGSNTPYFILHRVILNGSRHLNVLFAFLGYFLPVILFGLSGTPFKKGALGTMVWVTLFSVFCLTELGGTDLARFAAYSFLPLIVMLSRFEFSKAPIIFTYVLMATFYFNKIWLPLPFEDQEAYLNFYGGVGDRLNIDSLYRWIELLVLILLAVVLGKVQKKSRLWGREGEIR